MYHKRIWHESILIAGSAVSLCLVVSADKVSQLSVDDGVRVCVRSCRQRNAITRRLVHDRSTRWGWGLVVPSRLVLARSTMWLVQQREG